MSELSPISHNWTEEDRLRLISRISTATIYETRSSNSVAEILDTYRLSTILIADLSNQSSAYLEAMRSAYDRYLENEER